MTPTASSEAAVELYSTYASGRLDPAFSLMLETQSMLRPDVRRTLAASEAISGLMLETEQPAAMKTHALQSALDLIEGIETAGNVPGSPPGARDMELEQLPNPLRDHAVDAFRASGWRGVAGGIARLGLDVGSDLEVELYRIEPGARVPRHSHGGQEFTLVVQGGFSDETGSYGPGDLSVNGPEDVHQPVGDPGEVCFALAVRDAGLRFTGMLGLVQRVLGH